MDKEDISLSYMYTCTYIVEFYSSHKKEWNNDICSNTNKPKDDHTKSSKSDRERQIPYDITFMWNLKHGTNEFTYKSETDSHSGRGGIN